MESPPKTQAADESYDLWDALVCLLGVVAALFAGLGIGAPLLVGGIPSGTGAFSPGAALLLAVAVLLVVSGLGSRRGAAIPALLIAVFALLGLLGPAVPGMGWIDPIDWVTSEWWAEWRGQRVPPLTLIAILGAAGGVALAAWPRSRRPALMGLLGALACGAGIAALLGHAFEIHAVHAWSAQAGIGKMSALAIFFLGAGVAALGWRVGGEALASGPVFLPTVLATTLLTVTLVLWHGLGTAQEAGREQRVFSQLVELRDELQVRLDLEMAPLVRLANGWERSRPDRAAWTDTVIEAMSEKPALMSVEYWDSSTRPKWSIGSLDGEIIHRSPAGRGFDASGLWPGGVGLPDDARAAFLGARESRRGTIVRLPVEQPRYLWIQPLFPGKYFDGYLVGEWNARELIRTVASSEFFPGYSIRVEDGPQEIFHREAGTPSAIGPVDMFIDFFGARWRVSATVTSQELGRLASPLPLLVLVAGAMLAMLLAFLVHFATSAHLRADEREQVNLDLAESEARYRRQATELAEARTAVEDALDSQNRFLIGVARDLATLVGGIQPLLGELHKASTGKRAKRPLQSLEAWLVRVRTLSDEITDYIAKEKGTLALAHDDFDLEAVIRKALEIVMPAAEQRGISLDLGLHEGVPPSVNGDPSRLTRVLIHVCADSVALLATGRVVLEVSRERSAEGGARLLRFAFHASGEPLADDLSGMPVNIGEGPQETPDIAHSVTREMVKRMGGTSGSSIESVENHKVISVWFTVLLDRATRRREADSSGAGEPGGKPSNGDEPVHDVTEELVSAFLQEWPILVNRLQSSAVMEEWSEFRSEVAHLREASEALGLEKVSIELERMESDAGNVPSDELLVRLRGMEGDLREVAAELERDLRQLRSRSRNAA